MSVIENAVCLVYKPFRSQYLKAKSLREELLAQIGQPSLEEIICGYIQNLHKLESKGQITTAECNA